MHPTAQKVADAARQLDLDLNIIEFSQPTRSAQEAADTIGCDVAQIVKSLCFLLADQPIVVLVSGANQLDVHKLAKLCAISRKQIRRANADLVKAATGFSIGGVPPFGHTESLPVYVDEDLLQFDVVWAAAGTPFAVFAISPVDLVRVTRGIAASLKM